MIKHVCFDLDGTLVDSKETILESTKAALNQLKINHKIDSFSTGAILILGLKMDFSLGRHKRRSACPNIPEELADLHRVRCSHPLEATK
jgi:beta-phosphoglucomutase-like phosphatase (HAD superfamily)